MTEKILDAIKDIPINKLINNTGQLYESYGIPENPRRINKNEFEKLLKSIQDSDLNDVKPLHVLPHDGKYIVLGGNQRLRAYKKLKYKSVKCFILCDGLDIKIYQKIIITDNSHFGSHDEDILANMFNVEDLLEWGVELPELDIDLIPEETQGDDEVPESAPAITVKGDLYLLGEHRVLCGDSTMIDDVEKLMDGTNADMVFTDPPYGVNYTSRVDKNKRKPWGEIKNDNLKNESLWDFLYESVGHLSCNRYICCNWQSYIDFETALGKPNALIVWDKESIGLGAGHRNQHEFILFYGKLDHNSESNVWKCKRENTGSYKHPTQKPVEIPERGISNLSGTVCYDAFLGSGSTLIACEKTNRKCYGMELDEKYCDVIVKRYIEFCVKNNKDAKVYRNGELISNEVFLV